MSALRQHWLAVVFVLLALGAVVGIALLASGRWRIDGEVLGLAVGGILVALIWLGLARR